jgi:hypothetical protein
MVPRIGTLLVVLAFVFLLPGYMIYRDLTRPVPPPSTVDFTVVLKRLDMLEAQIKAKKDAKVVKETKVITKVDTTNLEKRIKKLEDAITSLKNIFTKFQNIILKRIEPPYQFPNDR